MSREPVTRLLDKLVHWDKDERYMAISDIMSHLDAGKEVDTATESKITAAVLSRIEQDSSNDVRSLSVRCLSTLVARVSVKQIVAMCNTLCNLLTTGDEGMRDVYLLGGKTVVKDAPRAAGPHVASTMNGFLLPVLSGDDSSDALRCTVLDLCSDLFARFGGEVAADHPVIVDALLQKLSSPNDTVRKRSSAALGHLAAFLDDELFGRAVARALTAVQENRSSRDVRTMIQVLATMSAGAGYRMGSYLPRAVPLLVRTLGDPGDEAMEGDAGDESRETCFAALRSFAQRCPAAMADHVDTVLAAARNFLNYDPNYQDEDEDEDEDGGGMDEEDGEEEEEDFADEYEDMDFDEQDDDSSWKVRRAALLAIAAIIESRPEALGRVYKECGITLAKRCKERELSVRHTVLQTLTQLLSASVVEAQAAGSGQPQRADATASHAPAPAPLRRQRSIGGSLQTLAPRLIQRVAALIRPHGAGGSISLKIRGEALRMTRELINAVESGKDSAVLEGDLISLIPAVLAQQGDSAPSVRLGVIRAVDAFLRAFPSVLSGPHAGDVVGAVCRGTRDDWFKVVAASLATTAPLAAAMRGGAKTTEAHVSEVFAALRPWLESADTDQEVRDAAMAASGAAVAALGEAASHDAERILGLLVDRLSNESTRLSALRALHAVTVAPGTASLPLAPFAKPFFAAASAFFRMQDRNLRQYALQASAALAKHPTVRDAVDREAASEAADSLAAAVSGSDQYLSALAIQVAAALVEDAECPAQPVADALVGPVLALGTSADAAAVTMDAVLPFLRATAAATGRASELYARAVEPAAKAADVSREASLNVARCGAALLAAMPPAERDSTIDGVVETVRSAGGGGAGGGSEEGEAGHLIALATTGFAGLELPLDRHSDLFRLFLDAFARGSEDANAVAARALGCLAASPHNSAQCLPPLLDSLRRQEHVYHLLIALRGALARHASVDTAETLPVVIQFLASEDENVQTVAAECTGHLLAQQPEPVLEKLEKFASAEEQAYRAAVCQAVRHAATLADAASHEGALRDIVARVLALIKDPEVSVRKAALRALNSVAHHRPNLVSRHFEAAREEGVLANVAAETVVDPALKKTVDLGPFKHKIDEGLPLRKTAFACLNTLLESVPERVNVEVVMACVLRGLSDVDDVQLQCHEVLSRVARGWPAHIMSHLEALLQSPNGLALAVFKRKKRGPPPTGLELERMHDVVRSGLRALQSVGAIPGAADTRLYKDFMHRVAEDKTASFLLEEIGH